MERQLDQWSFHAYLSIHAPSRLSATREMIDKKRTDFGPSLNTAVMLMSFMESNTAAAVILADIWTSKLFQDLNARERYLNSRKSTSDASMNVTLWLISTTSTYLSRREARNMLF